MSAVIITILISATLIFLNERFGLLSRDHFPTTFHKIAAYAWIALFTLVVSFLVITSSRASGEVDLENMTFWSLFLFHLLMVIYLFGWWLLTSMPPVSRFLNLDLRDIQGYAIGIGVGVGGWAVTIAVAIVIGLIVTAIGMTPEQMEPSPMIPWMAGLPWWKKGLIVLSAMTVEEAFFRGWLQKRVGLIPSTIVFAISHAGYGQPLMLIGITVVSLVIGATFYYTRKLMPCIIAHGVFDAIQLFVLVPFVIRFSGLGT